MLTRRERLILLNMVPGIGSLHLRRLEEAFGDLERIFNVTPQQLQGVEGIGPALARRIASTCRDERLVAQELRRVEASGTTLVTQDDAAYPASLKTIHD